MKLYLIRHGQTDHNLNGIVQGWTDTHLNQAGHQQAQDAADSCDYVVDAIFCSDLARTQETAQYFREKYQNIPFFSDWRLRERSFGDAENKSKDMQDWEVFWSSKDSVSIPNAEILDKFDHRLLSFVDDLKKYHTYNSVLIVTHGGVLNGLQRLINKIIEPVFHQNGTVITMDVPNDQPRVLESLSN